MNEIVQQLLKNRTPYLQIDSFSDKPGIYVLFFVGRDFPLANCSPKKEDIIYIGKTQSSQASRDRDTHYAAGKTGSSTLRRSFGAMLRSALKLNPIPRGQADIDKLRTSHFKFDQKSEEKLSEWMRNNLALSFYEFTKGNVELDELESFLVKQIQPILNIDRKNPDNPFKSAIAALRKETGLMAYSEAGQKLSAPKPTKTVRNEKKNLVPKVGNVVKNLNVSANVHKYEDIWKQVIPSIIKAIQSNQSIEINIGRSPFESVGNRKSYSFRLDIEKGSVSNNIGGSAVARDFARVLLNDLIFRKLANSRNISLRLDKSFTLYIINN